MLGLLFTFQDIPLIRSKIPLFPEFIITVPPHYTINAIPILLILTIIIIVVEFFRSLWYVYYRTSDLTDQGISPFF